MQMHAHGSVTVTIHNVLEPCPCLLSVISSLSTVHKHHESDTFQHELCLSPSPPLLSPPLLSPPLPSPPLSTLRNMQATFMEEMCKPLRHFVDEQSKVRRPAEDTAQKAYKAYVDRRNDDTKVSSGRGLRCS